MKSRAKVALVAFAMAGILSGCSDDSTAKSPVNAPSSACPNYELKPNPDIDFYIDTYKSTMKKNVENGVLEAHGVTIQDITTTDIIESLDYGVTCEQAEAIRQDLINENTN